MTKDDRVRFTFRLPKKLMDKLKTESHEQGVSVNSLILKILHDWVESQEKKKGG